MRILICAPEAPLPPLNGFRLMVSALVAELARRHDVRVLAFRLPDQEATLSANGALRLLPRPVPGVRALVRAAVRRRPLRLDGFSAGLRAALSEELEHFDPDVVQVSGALVGLGDALSGRASVLAALDAWHLNVEARALASVGPRRWLLRSEAARLRRLEATEFRLFGRVVVVSDADRSTLEALDPTLRIAVIPNGVDAAFYAPDPAAARDRLRIVFTGVMSYAPNIMAADFLARRVLPRVRAVRPDAHLVIVGRSPARRVRDLAALEGVDVTGTVPDLRPWLRESGAYACPMVSGTGIKNKLLEAMASGVPCVATPLALQGLDVTPGRELLVGEHEEELAALLVGVLDDDDLARRLADAARAYVVASHDWGAVARAYEREYEGVVRKTHPAAISAPRVS